VSFVGRLATYKYYNMDQVVAQALTTFRKLRAQLTGESETAAEPVAPAAAAAAEPIAPVGAAAGRGRREAGAGMALNGSAAG
jgi:UDP-galactopyranose mutase